MHSRHLVLSRAAALAAAFAILVIGAGLASADDTTEQARAHYVRGVELFESADYSGAISQFTAAGNIKSSPVLDFNIALCHERLGNKSDAVRHYRDYLGNMPTAANRGAVEGKIARLEKEIADAAASTEPGYEILPDSDPPPTGDSGDTAGAPPAPPAPPAPSAPPAPRTGDPELDRVAGVDIGSIRDQRRLGGAAAAPELGATGDDASSASGNSTSAGYAPPVPPPEEPAKKPKPIYKKWWFWVVVGVSAIILVDIATSDSGDGSNNRILLDPSLDRGAMAPAQGGWTVRF